MALKLLRGEDGASVLLVYPSTLKESTARRSKRSTVRPPWRRRRSCRGPGGTEACTRGLRRHHRGAARPVGSARLGGRRPSAHGGRGGGVRTARRRGQPGRGRGRTARRPFRGRGGRAAGHRDWRRGARRPARTSRAPRPPRPDARVAGGRWSPVLRLRDAARRTASGRQQAVRFGSATPPCARARTSRKSSVESRDSHAARLPRSGRRLARQGPSRLARRYHSRHVVRMAGQSGEGEGEACRARVTCPS